MCGFAGLLTPKAHGQPSLRDRLGPMSDALVHRGPDDQGFWDDPVNGIGFAFRRLSILDLSPAGRQPMVSAGGRFRMVFNGEVYNFQSLREILSREGIPFRGDSDSEVVVNAVERWGVRGALERFIGMFAFAVWDHQDHVLWLTRDRLGIKPLYLAQVPGGFAFASELGALMRLPGFAPTLDREALGLYLKYLYYPAPLTPFQGVRKLRPGHLVRLSASEVKDSRAEGFVPQGEPWWSVPAVCRGEATGAGSPGSAGGFVPGGPGEDSDAVDQLEGLLRDSVRLRMIADVPLGALLSGGVDSSVVVALMQQLSSNPVRTFTIGFDDPTHDESTAAREVARHLGTSHTELQVSGTDALDVIPRLPGIFNEPLADPSQIPTWLVCGLARKDVTVALTGDGGDELFGGYTRHSAGARLIPGTQRLPLRLRRILGRALQGLGEPAWDRMAARVPRVRDSRLIGQKAHKMGRLLTARTPAEAYCTLLSTKADRFRIRWADSEDRMQDPLESLLHERTQTAQERLTLQDMLLVDQRYYLPDDLLQKVDRASMAVSLEARVPILDHRVVEFSWHLPDSLKIREGRGKWILRQVLYRHVPQPLVDRPKTGFSVPLAQWMRGPLLEWAADLLTAPSPERDALFEPYELMSAWRDLRHGRSEDALSLWVVLMFEAWRREWGISPA